MTTIAVPTPSDMMQNRMLSGTERQTIRLALTRYCDDLEKKAKQLSDLGLHTDEITDKIRMIKGRDTQPGLIGVFTEQLSLGDEAQIRIDDVARALKAASEAVVHQLYDLPDFPGRPEDTSAMVRFVQTWRDAEREEALMYALGANSLQEGEVNTTPMPDRVRQALARAREWAMSDEECEHWLARGPWSVGYEAKVSEGVGLWFAVREDAHGTVLETDPDRFDTEHAAELCAARLNQHAYLTTADQTEDDRSGNDGAEDEDRDDDDRTEG